MRLVAHQPVQHAARLLRVYQLIVDLARVLQGARDGGGRNFVEFDAVLAVFELQHVFQMPGDRLPLAVRVGREIDVVRLGGLVGEALDDLLLVRIDDVGGFEVVFDIHAQPLFGQVADVAARGVHAVLPL